MRDIRVGQIWADGLDHLIVQSIKGKMVEVLINREGEPTYREATIGCAALRHEGFTLHQDV